ncbi:MAG TPA: radical SAM protein [Sandaracinaceae bacterium LLY-WYZ-13_1]|nr:radical SAM protein [Sandaracinaceae bacterium LLY-WYZ-13_1]
MRDAQLNVYNVDRMLAQPPQAFEALRVDPNNDCNVRCVYCHNHRSKERLARSDFERFLADHVTRVDFLQLGCVMEPTLDPRLTEFLRAAADARVRPGSIALQTNGILLHRHDHGVFRDAGLARIMVSVDSARRETTKHLRGGTSLAKVRRNVEAVRERCPATEVWFVTTVCRENLDQLEDLVDLGLALGVHRFVLREIFHDPASDVVSHDAVRALLLDEGEFAAMEARLTEHVAGRAALDFNPVATLAAADERIVRDSLRRDARPLVTRKSSEG